MLLKVSGVTRLVEDVELRYLPGGKAVGTLRLANSKKYKEKEYKSFIQATIFGKGAEVLSQYTHKGSQLYIEAELNQDTWEDAQGNKKSAHKLTITEFQLLDKKEDKTVGRDTTPRQQYSQPEIDINDDEIMF